MTRKILKNLIAQAEQERQKYALKKTLLDGIYYHNYNLSYTLEIKIRVEREQVGRMISYYHGLINGYISALHLMRE